MSGEIIPFGKYKGQPIEAAVQDRQYVDWLTAQPWFKERFGNLYTLIVNNFQEPTETPAHNALQARFLDLSFCARFLGNVFPGSQFEKTSVEFETAGFDAAVCGSYVKGTYNPNGYGQERVHVEAKPTVGDDYPAVLRQIRSAKDRSHAIPQKMTGDYNWDRVSVPVLFLEEYTGVGATMEQFIAIFENSGVKVIFLDEVT